MGIFADAALIVAGVIDFFRFLKSQSYMKSNIKIVFWVRSHERGFMRLFRLEEAPR